LTDNQLRSLQSELLEEALRQLRQQPRFRTSPELQRAAANYEYQLRSNRELEHWIQYYQNNPRRRQVQRYVSKKNMASAIKPAADPATSAMPRLGRPTPAANNAPARLAEPSATPSKTAPDPLPDNVVALPTPLNRDNLHSKLFHTPRQQEDVW
jgi:hypothetical protein